MACDKFFDLPNGYKMPAIGYGTWQATNESELETALNVALETGYRHIDTAYIYRNEHVIGNVLTNWFSSGNLSRKYAVVQWTSYTPRWKVINFYREIIEEPRHEASRNLSRHGRDIFLVTKLPPCGMRADDVPTFLQSSLEKLQVDYVDLFLLHVPFGLKNIDGNLYPTTPDGSTDMDNGTDHLAIWKAMEDQVDAGLTKAIGLSNFNKSQIGKVLEQARIRPACLQVELHVYLQQNELVKYCHDNNMVVTAYSTLGSPGLKKLGLEIPDVLSNPVVTRIARKHGKTPAQTVLKHLVQKNIAVIPKSVTPKRIRENFDIFDFTLDEKDMDALNALDKEIRILDFNFFFKGIKNHPEYPFQ